MLLQLDRASLRASGMADHAVNGLYRSLGAHAAAFRGLVMGQLEQQGGRHVLPALALLLAPGAETTTPDHGETLLRLAAGRQHKRAAQEASQEEGSTPGTADQQQMIAPAAGTSAAATAAAAAATAAAAASQALVAEYAGAYTVVKEQLEVRLRHEAQRADYYEARCSNLEGDACRLHAQLEEVQRWVLCAVVQTCPCCCCWVCAYANTKAHAGGWGVCTCQAQ